MQGMVSLEHVVALCITFVCMQGLIGLVGGTVILRALRKQPTTSSGIDAKTLKLIHDQVAETFATKWERTESAQRKLFAQIDKLEHRQNGTEKLLEKLLERVECVERQTNMMFDVMASVEDLRQMLVATTKALTTANERLGKITA